MNSEQRQSELDSFDSEDLPWQAFCYIADELDDHARQAFETRLETDQTARAAVAAAVADSMLLDAAIGSTQTPGEVADPKQPYHVNQSTSPISRLENFSSPPVWRRPASLLTTAAALLLVALIWNFNSKTASVDDLAEVWSSNTFESSWSEPLGDENDFALYEAIDDEATDDPLFEFDADSDGWMVAALDADSKPEIPNQPDFPETDEGGLPCLQ